MQLDPVLTEEETQHIARFVETPEAARALEQKFKVVSLTRTLDAGGYTTITRRAEKKLMKKFLQRTNPVYQGRRYPVSTMRPTHEVLIGSGGGGGIDFVSNTVVDNNISMPDYMFTPGADLRKWNVPKLGVVARGHNVVLRSHNGAYHYFTGDKELSFAPHWHSPFPGKGEVGMNLYKTEYLAICPPIPREAASVLDELPSGLILFEAAWEKQEQFLDPAIIVPVWRDLYAVAYTWELSKAETAALRKASDFGSV